MSGFLEGCGIFVAGVLGFVVGAPLYIAGAAAGIVVSMSRAGWREGRSL